MQDYKKLHVYEEAYSLSIAVCKIIKNSRHQRIREQLMGSVTSIPANLTEFAGMEQPKQKLEKLRTCIREANETEHWLNTFKDLDEMSPENYKEFSEKLIIVRKMLHNLLKSLEPQHNAAGGK